MKKNEILVLRDGSVIMRPVNKIIFISPAGEVKVIPSSMIKTLIKTRGGA